MPGMAPISLQQFINPTTGYPYAGARASFFEASSSTPILVYQDYGLGTPHSNPVIADAYGRFPPIFIDEDVEFYRLRLSTSGGVVLPLGDSGSFDIDVLPVIGPSAGVGGGAVTPVDSNSVLQTGDVIWTPAKTTRAGFVRMNGRTIGSASSGASERANSDCEDLYTFLYSNFANTICAVSGGRGASAAADWAANKPISIIDMRSKAPFGLDDMGATALSAFTGITFALGNATTGGAAGGAARQTILTANLPAIKPTLTQGTVTSKVTNINDGGGTSVQVVSPAGGGTSTTAVTAAAPVFASNLGSATAFDKMSPFVLGTYFMRL